MSSRLRQSANRPALIALCLFYACMALAVLATATAHAGDYKMVLCAGNNGSNSFATATNTTSPQNPGGIFSFENYCGPAPDPAGNNAFLRIAENQSGGNAGVNAYGSISWTVPPWVAIIAGGGYTRMPNAFNDGWRGRFWAEGWDGSTNNILMQGSGVANGSLGGIGWSPCSTFCSHLWPFGGYGDYRRFVFEMTCVRPAGCDRANFNAVDANTMVLILADRQDASASFIGSETVNGSWVRGWQGLSWFESEQGSGLRFSRLKVDNATLGDGTIDYQAGGSCNTGYSDYNHEFARVFQPCPVGTYQRWYGLETKNYSDGQHELAICVQDYGQYHGGSESCDRRTIRTDNTAPGKPAELRVTSTNPARYLDHFGAAYSLPPNQGSPVTKVHYDVVDATGKVVMPEKILSATNPTVVPNIEGPPKAAELYLRAWLEDQVGLVGQPAIAPVPRDTTPPAAPQELSVTAPTTSRAAQGFDVRWRNEVDAGSPIDEVHYQLLNPSGGVAVQTQTIEGSNVEKIQDLETPQQRGKYTLKVWLEDAEGNVGVSTTAPLSYECLRSDVSGGTGVTSGLGEKGTAEEIVDQGDGSTLRGRLTGAGGGVADASLCVFSRVVTKDSRDFLGVAVTGSDGDYQFAIPAGASREVGVAYRSGSREVSSRATLKTIVHPTFKVYKKVVRNKSSAKFLGSIPGPDNNDVLVVLQVKRGKGWLAFRRYRTREGGLFTVPYKFNKTNVATKYLMRVQVREQSGYPYSQGNSDNLTLIVVPKAARQRGDGRRSRQAPQRRPGSASNSQLQRRRGSASSEARLRPTVGSRR